MCMPENGKKNVDFEALLYFGKAYVKTPRVMTNRMFSPNKSERMAGKIHWLLFNFCNYADNDLCIGGKLVFCAKGEYITTYEKLAELAGMSSRSVRRYVGTLVKEGLVDVRQVAGQVCFRVNGYSAFTEPDVLQKEVTKPIGLGHTPRFDLLNQL